ncbi:ABC-type nitrate/sulfonate/bicarbonate transport system ATPase subunit [Dysgonomonas sp. PH5-45]|uniref:ABC transporter ATP-binding protein n=1 Tax=unclassified Dysgonomonas TaxID=2630389 RepID=UPI002475CBFF|nr:MULTISPECIES: ABC transporter ATP-binding protein [unclassified Dysgonomonas]MDH6354974.1 ABC-type nitrate/sulfonate/bicarbonate transport system ATPase subunit [Dysgonomonas sp. PH5-45]MDH6387902.1 ABC-type nitrate/sulfonate/bicarbonate transport system ATPase subunit [Dysgonomonas sp. PH5-37]
MISIKNLSVRYPQGVVLKDFSLSMNRGQIYALIGPSGCGKSTLLKVLCGIVPKESGTIEYGTQEKDISIGYVPQSYGLLDWKTVEQNILLPLRLKKKLPNTQEITGVLRSLEIEDLLKRYPKDLSGGQRQRIALARAFVSQPDLLLMDEPFSALDAFTSQTSQKLFLRLWSKYKVTTLLITHNVREAARLGQHILIMDKQSGQITHQLPNPAFGEEASNNLRFDFGSRILDIFAENNQEEK